MRPCAGPELSRRGSIGRRPIRSPRSHGERGELWSMTPRARARRYAATNHEPPPLAIAAFRDSRFMEPRLSSRSPPATRRRTATARSSSWPDRCRRDARRARFGRRSRCASETRRSTGRIRTEQSSCPWSSLLYLAHMQAQSSPCRVPRSLTIGEISAARMGRRRPAEEQQAGADGTLVPIRKRYPEHIVKMHEFRERSVPFANRQQLGAR